MIILERKRKMSWSFNFFHNWVNYIYLLDLYCLIFTKHLVKAEDKMCGLAAFLFDVIVLLLIEHISVSTGDLGHRYLCLVFASYKKPLNWK